MRLVRMFPGTVHWQELLGSGAEEFLGEKTNTEFWAICKPEAIGVLGFEQLTPDTCECGLWVKQEVRGRWFTRSFYPMLLGIGFSRATSIVACVEEGSASHRMMKRWGWEIYCQRGNLSYYQIHKERLHA